MIIHIWRGRKTQLKCFAKFDFFYLIFFTYFWAVFFLNSVPIKVHSVWSLLNWSRSNFIISMIRINFIQINLNLRKCYFRKNLDLRKIVPTHTLNPLGNLCHFFCIFYNTLVIFETIFCCNFHCWHKPIRGQLQVL